MVRRKVEDRHPTPHGDTPIPNVEVDGVPIYRDDHDVPTKDVAPKTEDYTARASGFALTVLEMEARRLMELPLEVMEGNIEPRSSAIVTVLGPNSEISDEYEMRCDDIDRFGPHSEITLDMQGPAPSLTDDEDEVPEELEDVEREYVDEPIDINTFARSCSPEEVANGLDRCSICLEDYGNGHLPMVLKACKHVFGDECLKLMASTTDPVLNRCPFCRVELFAERESRPVLPSSASSSSPPFPHDWPNTFFSPPSP
ncbi:hypothetical protein BU16DRAFT_566143 [Lophium mytilinum]|uniref:RING-type domain-containing protein n=1 Tax=Lophium mytilinum TaxID=390894 RepID=A0A6A6QGC0_9PEZI|nr:hypothetical protein BU16DRAFT_566143 [Lophium mytilinum]